MNLADIPRVRLAHLPTPLEPLPRLSAHLGGPPIYIKRDDQTGLGMGGNKVRKLEFLVADALAQGCDTLVTTGGVQSNHARQTAAAAARLGLHCELLLPRLVADRTPEYEETGNVLLEKLFGATVHILPREDFHNRTFDQALAVLRSAGRKPYFIPVGGSTPRGVLGYMVAADELLAQTRELAIDCQAIVVATGSSGTHGGILAGLVAQHCTWPVLGMSVSGTTADREALVSGLATEALALAGVSAELPGDRVRVFDQYVGAAYGQPTEAMLEALRLTAELEGILLDPVYTGKAMAGLIDLIRTGRLAGGKPVVFWHTGGSAALFAYREIF